MSLDEDPSTAMIKKIQEILAQNKCILSSKEITEYFQEFENSQKYFPRAEQYALMIRLFEEWKNRVNEKILIITTEYSIPNDPQRAITFGIISSDWPGLSDSCIGVIHEKGWNAFFAIGITLNYNEIKLGLIIVSILTQNEREYEDLNRQLPEIIQDIRKASVGNSTKMYLLNEEIKKLQIYSSVIDKIEEQYRDPDINKIIGPEGEAIKYFASRSREYIANRDTEEIAQQIITNYKFQHKVHQYKRHMHVEIRNFFTKKEGEFTGITVAGDTSQTNLDNLLQSIERAVPDSTIKHHKNFTTEDGISVHHFELTNKDGSALSDLQTKQLNETFKDLDITKRRERQNWLESIGGFEHYARAIIPFLIKQNQITGQNQVFMSVLQSTEHVIDFKILIVLAAREEKMNKIMYQCVNKLDSYPGFYISKIKPPTRHSDREVLILDLTVDLTINKEIESVYQKVKKALEESFGKFRDFDEGMRQMDLRNFQGVRNLLSHIKESRLREYYYSLEDFYRITATAEEIAIQINLALEIQTATDPDEKYPQILWQKVKLDGLKGSATYPATVIVISYPEKIDLLEKILSVFEEYELVLSKLERNERKTLICRLSKNRKALGEEEVTRLVEQIKNLK